MPGGLGTVTLYMHSFFMGRSGQKYVHMYIICEADGIFWEYESTTSSLIAHKMECNSLEPSGVLSIFGLTKFTKIGPILEPPKNCSNTACGCEFLTESKNFQSMPHPL